MSAIILSVSSSGLRLFMNSTNWVLHTFGVVNKTIRYILNAIRWVGNKGKTALSSVYIYGTRSDECPY